MFAVGLLGGYLLSLDAWVDDAEQLTLLFTVMASKKNFIFELSDLGDQTVVQAES